MALTLTASSPRPAFAVYDRTGLTKRANLQLIRDHTFLHEQSQPGALSFSIALDDPAIGYLTAGAIVKAFFRGHGRVGARIGDQSTEHAVDGKVYRRWENLPGLLDMWNDVVIAPEYGLRATSTTQRTFGFVNRIGHWYDSGNWTDANGFHWTDDTGLKKGLPPGFKSTNPMWIAKTDPYHSLPPDSVLWFRRGFTTTSTITYQLLAAGDDFMTIYIDGEQVFTPDQQEHQSWRYLAVIDGKLPAGPHVISAKVQNSHIDGEENPVSFIAALQQTNRKGEPVKGPAVLITDTNWQVSSVRPSWGAAEVISRCITEGREANVDAASILHRGFTDATDTDGVAWTDAGEYTFDVGSTLLAASQRFTEHLIDIDINPSTMNVHAYDRKGSDLSGTVQLKTGRNGGSLLDYDVSRVWPRYNSALIQKRDSTWIIDEDSASVGDWGRAQIGLSVGSTPDTDTAREASAAQFRETARSTFQYKVELSVLTGPQPYRDFNLGDYISIPNEDDDGYVKARVIAITIDASGETVRQWAECRDDPSV